MKRWIGVCAAALLTLAPAAVLAQPSGGGASVYNSVGIWGQDAVTGLPCLTASATPSPTCVQPGTAFSYKNVAAGATTLVKTGAGILHELNIGLCVAAATITVYDSLTGSGTKIGTFTCPATVAAVPPLYHDVAFATGLTVVTSGATDVTAAYR